jgi:hypothetical protein
MLVSSVLQKWVSKLQTWMIVMYAGVCSFGVYFCMYAFRKPFTVAGFDGLSFLHIDYKVWLVTAQVVGYMLSKFYGIRFISSMQKEKRAVTIVKLILISWIALWLFAITPRPWNIIFLFVNGFPLGMVWGLVFAYLEGRKQTEFMGAILSVNFIFSSGAVKSVGKFFLVEKHISEMWMPFCVGCFFILPMLLFTWLLNHVPEPTKEDIQIRSERKPMTRKERSAFIAMFLPGIIMIVSTYVLLTGLRDYRDNFANEMWTELGFKDNVAIFTEAEIPISVIVLICTGLLILAKNNMKAFMINHYIIISGYILAIISTLLFTHHLINPVAWMITVGMGLYLSYVPFNAIYFERMIATFRIKGNVGFVMYIADAFGYMGSVVVLFSKQFFGLQISWTIFFIAAVFIIGAAGTA